MPTNELEKTIKGLAARIQLRTQIPKPSPIVLECLDAFLDGAYWSFQRAINQAPINPRAWPHTKFPEIIFSPPDDNLIIAKYRLPPHHQLVLSSSLLIGIHEEGLQSDDPISKSDLLKDIFPLHFTLGSLWSTTGVEEGDHAGFFGRNIPIDPIRSYGECGYNIRNYVSQPHEMRAQLAVREYARTHMHPSRFSELVAWHEAIGIMR